MFFVTNDPMFQHSWYGMEKEVQAGSSRQWTGPTRSTQKPFLLQWLQWLLHSGDSNRSGTEPKGPNAGVKRMQGCRTRQIASLSAVIPRPCSGSEWKVLERPSTPWQITIWHLFSKLSLGAIEIWMVQACGWVCWAERPLNVAHCTWQLIQHIPLQVYFWMCAPCYFSGLISLHSIKDQGDIVNTVLILYHRQSTV